MMSMGFTECIMRTLEGKPVERIPSWIPIIKGRTIHDVLGKPLISTESMAKNRFTIFPLDR
jgi:uroporphyrinogen-III decarboxylase